MGKYPTGLANSTDQVGRYYMRHTTGSVFGIMPGPVYWNRGTQMAGLIEDEAGHDPKRGFAGGYHFETIPLGFAVFGAVMMPGAWGEAYARDIEKYTRFAGMWICGEDLPQAGNRITRDATKKDRFGLAIPHVHYDDHVNDKRMRNHAFTQGRALYDALGAEKVYEATPFASGHNMGSCRMSEQARGRGLQQVGPDPRDPEPVHLGRQPVQHQRRPQPDPDDRRARDPPGRLHRRPDGQTRHLMSPSLDTDLGKRQGLATV